MNQPSTLVHPVSLQIAARVVAEYGDAQARLCALVDAARMHAMRLAAMEACAGLRVLPEARLSCALRYCDDSNITVSREGTPEETLRRCTEALRRRVSRDRERIDTERDDIARAFVPRLAAIAHERLQRSRRDPFSDGMVYTGDLFDGAPELRHEVVTELERLELYATDPVAAIVGDARIAGATPPSVRDILTTLAKTRDARSN